MVVNVHHPVVYSGEAFSAPIYLFFSILVCAKKQLFFLLRLFLIQFIKAFRIPLCQFTCSLNLFRKSKWPSLWDIQAYLARVRSESEHILCTENCWVDGIISIQTDELTIHDPFNNAADMRYQAALYIVMHEEWSIDKIIKATKHKLPIKNPTINGGQSADTILNNFIDICIRLGPRLK